MMAEIRTYKNVRTWSVSGGFDTLSAESQSVMTPFFSTFLQPVLIFVHAIITGPEEEKTHLHYVK
jgi:hypothetical protein